MKKVLLCIMDGIGIRESSKGNAFKNANTKTLDRLLKNSDKNTLRRFKEVVKNAAKVKVLESKIQVLEKALENALKK